MPNTSPFVKPRLLFFSGGSALSGLCQSLKQRNLYSIHLVTPFDSGGSSAKLRQAFAMPAVGDLRCRILDLANPALPGHEQLLALLGYRLPVGQTPGMRRAELERLAQAQHPLMLALASDKQRSICQQLRSFLAAMSDGFDLSGASIGNLVLAGAYLTNGRRLGASVQMLSSLVEAQGRVESLTEASLHLGAELADGRILLGQHLLTGKEAPTIESPIHRLWLNASLTALEPMSCRIDAAIVGLIQNADLICYPPGSFYSSLVANLLPEGVAEAIAANPCLKVYVPNLGPDPEQLGLDIEGQLKGLLGFLKGGAPHARNAQLVSALLVDCDRGEYQGQIRADTFKSLGIEVRNVPLLRERGQCCYDGDALVQALLDCI